MRWWLILSICIGVAGCVDMEQKVVTTSLSSGEGVLLTDSLRCWLDDYFQSHPEAQPEWGYKPKYLRLRRGVVIRKGGDSDGVYFVVYTDSGSVVCRSSIRMGEARAMGILVRVGTDIFWNDTGRDMSVHVREVKVIRDGVIDCTGVAWEVP